MLAAALPLSFLLFAQVRVGVQVGERRTVGDSAAVERVVHADSARRDTTTRVRRPRIAVTAEHIATAFEDAPARTLLERARVARLAQDSSLLSYDAETYQRISVGLGLKAIGRERLFMRHENSARVRWQRGHGAVIDVTGSRTVFPALMGARVSADVNGTGSIPYYPGRDDLWFGAEAMAAERPDVELIHPIAAGAEAYYRFSSGDSVIFRLHDGSTIRLVELRVRPRQPDWRLAVGSLWFDASTAQLVRAVYRLAVPVDFWYFIREEGEEDDIPLAVRPLITPMTGTVTSLMIEHGLYEGRYWLPRAQAAEGEMQVGFMRVPVRLEESFDYAVVNGLTEELPEIRDVRIELVRDSVIADSLGLSGSERRDWLRERRRERRIAQREAGDQPACDDGATERLSHQSRHNGIVPLLVRTPCDTVALVGSPSLPPSIYAPGEEVFSKTDLEEMQRMIGFSAQAGFGPQRPTLLWGPTRNLLRYNRVEGLSAGIGARQELGQGLALEGLAQIGIADLQPNAELSLSRSDGARTVRIGAYRRLVAANDWGTPLGFGSSLNAVLFGRDEGFYYRALGAELAGTGIRGSRFEWRLFAERHDAAEVETHFSLANALHGLRFIDNIAADDATLVGVGARLTRTFGLDPQKVRLFGDIRLEGGSGDFTYGRAAVDATLSRSITSRLAGALTAGGGTTLGEVPVQRLWYLGGTQTVRGQTAGTAAGDAYWLARAELGGAFVAARPLVFFDLGWAGDRADWRNPGQPMSGAGIGASIMDGLLRFDVARGIRPRERWTANLYFEATF